MSEKKIIAVVGATGKQGSSVANTFLTDPSYHVRALTRNISKPAAQALATAGATVLAADLDDPASLRKAFTGAHTVFAVTDFWGIMSDPATFSTADTEQLKPNEVAMRHEIQQGKNVCNVLAELIAEGQGPSRVVWSVLSDTKRWTGGKVTENYHFDGKAMIERYIRDTLPALAERTSFLQMGLYFDNHVGAPWLGPQKQPDGTYTFSWPSPDPSRPLPFVDTPVDTGTFVRALLRHPVGVSLLGVSEELTPHEWAKTWSQATGKDARFVPMTKEALAAVVPEVVQGEMWDTWSYMSAYGFTGGDGSVKTPRDLGVGDEELSKVATYMRGVEWGV